MLGCKSGFPALIKKVSPRVTGTDSMIHEQVLASKTFPVPLKGVLNQVIKAIHFIKSKALSTHLLKLLCEELGSLHDWLFFHTEVRWLSKGRTLQRVFELRSELNIFFSTQNTNEFESLSIEDESLCKLAYLADIFEQFNDINI